MILSDAELLEDDGGDNNDEESEDDAEADIHGQGVNEIKWGELLEGLHVAEAPERLDDSLVKKLIYYKWEKYGWLLGTIMLKFDPSSPRLFAKFNYRIEWMDGWKNHMLLLDNYACGRNVPYDSWVILEKDAPTRSN